LGNGKHPDHTRRDRFKSEPGSAHTDESIRERTRPLAESLCAAEGLEMVHLDYLRESGGRVMRLTIDKPGGVTLDDCAAISRELGDLLDVHLPEIGRYRLEVSSPGPQRRLSRESDFERFRGQRVKIRTRSPINGQKNFHGILEGVSADSVCLNTGATMVAIAMGSILRANLIDA
jgi:ribosome maturation factor RimP